MLKLNVIGNYSPNLRFKPGSCYYIEGFSRPVILDFGYGNFKKIINILEKKNINDTILIISHKHIDHCFDIIFLVNYLKKKNSKITVFMPKKSILFKFLKKHSDIFVTKELNEDTNFFIDDYTFSFCKTMHKVECYATKMQSKKNSFVYTADICGICNNLKKFCKEANYVLIDSGNPFTDNKLYLNGYHGNTANILNTLFDKDCNVKKVYASHLKAYIKDKYYLKIFPKGKDITIAKIGNCYDLK